MRKGRIINLVQLSSLPDQDPGKQPIYKVTTDWSEDQQNGFYMDRVDKNGRAVNITKTSEGTPDNPDVINWQDEITYDKQDGLRKVVIWRGRMFRQRGYSFNDR